MVRSLGHSRLSRPVSESTGVTRPPCLSSRALPPDTTTAWMSSATMTCWMQPQARRWQRATRPASAWRTAPVTSATSSATRARLTRRSGSGERAKAGTQGSGDKALPRGAGSRGRGSREQCPAGPVPRFLATPLHGSKGLLTRHRVTTGSLPASLPGESACGKKGTFQRSLDGMVFHCLFVHPNAPFCQSVQVSTEHLSILPVCLFICSSVQLPRHPPPSVPPSWLLCLPIFCLVHLPSGL